MIEPKRQQKSTNTYCSTKVDIMFGKNLSTSSIFHK